MKHSNKTRGPVLGAALLIGLASIGSARTAQASTDFPAALQKALEAHFQGQSFCVPLCTACHNTTKGGPRDLNVFGTNLELKAGLFLGNVHADDKVAGAITKYFMTAPGPDDKQVNGKWDSDGDGISDEDELKVYSSPSLPSPRGDQEFCSDLKYGCGARIAAAPPPVDRVGLFAAGLAVLGLAALRRRNRHQSVR